MRTVTTDGYLIIVRINKESTIEPKEVVGEIIYCSVNSKNFENIEFREKKQRLANSSYEFSKIGFAIPDLNPITLESYAQE